MPPRASRILADLADLKLQFGRDSGRCKRDLLARLDAARLPSAETVTALHELLCFCRAYPDDRALLAQVTRMLDRFGERRDLRRFRDELANSGLEGTAVHYEFFMQMAQWVAERWPDRLSIDWEEYGDGEPIEKILSMLTLYPETAGLDEQGYTVREWLDLLKGPDETDATFLVRRIGDLELNTFQREYLYEHLAVPMTIAAGPGGPSRSRARLGSARVHFQAGPLNTSRPDLPTELRRSPERITPVSVRKGQAIIDLAREAMVTRSRDLDAFAFGDPNDVRLIDCGDGLQFAAIGLIPERRLMFEAVYGFLTFKNNVPIGYVLNSALFGSVEVAYNVFDTYRGGEAGHIYGRLLAALRHLFGADTFTIYPYQLGGDGNREGLESGAWWFYQKLGFRARDEHVTTLMNRELARMKKNPHHRSSIATLEELATENVFYDLGRPRQDVIGGLAMGRVGERITAFLSSRFGSQRREGAKVCVQEARRLLGVKRPRNLTIGEQLAWERWAPLALTLPGVVRWTAAEKRDFAAVISAKGGRRESDFVALFDGHRKLRRAVRRLATAD